MTQHRILSFNELLKRELGKIFLENLEFPEGTIVTIVRVDTSPDLQRARVYISIIPQETAKAVLRILLKSIFGIQQKINSRLQMRPIPKIEWVLDENMGKVLRIEELLERIKKRR